MDKRQRYSVKEATPSLHLGHFPSIGERSGGEPQCSYMYGGLGDLRREAYLCKSPLKANESAKKRSTANEDDGSKLEGKVEQYCDAATAAVKFQMAGAVKINPLLACSGSSFDEETQGLHKEENPVFYGQRTKIRKTKEQEMISALLEVAENGGKRKKRKLLGGKKRNKPGGPFILRPRPPLKNLTQHT